MRFAAILYSSYEMDLEAGALPVEDPVDDSSLPIFLTDAGGQGGTRQIAVWCKVHWVRMVLS